MNLFQTIRDWFSPPSRRARTGSGDAGKPLDPESAYRGAFPAILRPTKSDPLAEDNIRVPLVAQLVEASVGALLGDPVGAFVKLDIEGEDTTAQTVLDDFCTRSKWQATLIKAALDGALWGHVYLKLIVEDGQITRFQRIPARQVEVETDPRDIERAVCFTQSWETEVSGNSQTKLHHVEKTRYNAATDTWEIVEYEGPGAGRLVEISRVEWPLPWPPIFDCQNLTNPSSYDGLPDATDAVIRLNQSCNTALSFAARLLRKHAEPKTIFTGITADVNWMTDEALRIPDKATANLLQMDGRGAEGLIVLYHELREALHTVSRTPEVASGKLESTGGLSGTALSILYGPLATKTGEKCLHYGEMLKQLGERVLEQLGFPGVSVSVVWPDTIPKNGLETRQVAQIDADLGVASRETLARKLGYDWEVEQAQIQQETTDAATLSAKLFDAGALPTSPTRP